MSKETNRYLATRIIDILDKKCRNGCEGENYTWVGFQNGNGTECGVDIERLIKYAKRLLESMDGNIKQTIK